MNGSEAAIVASLTLIGRLPGAQVREDMDATVVASGRPLSSFNHVLGIAVSGESHAIEARIDHIHQSLTDARSTPATWWITPSTEPDDLGARLQARGFTAAEREYGMVIETDGVAAPKSDVEPVGPATLDAWLEVMARSYDWSDPRGSEAWASLYRAPIDERARPWRHVLVRRDGRAVACASLFTAGGYAFVTNVGTVPEARGHGSGTSATLAVLAMARDLGYRQASLAASEMGRSIYARIGFREDARLERWISG